MGQETGIQWADSTWNPVRGCTRVSEGCRHCYAEKMAGRFAGPGGPYEGLVQRARDGWRWTGDVRIVPQALDWPLRWRGAREAREEGRPSRIFVNSMSDLFHKALPFEYIAACFGVMAACPGHRFIVLTKRPEKALEFAAWLATQSSRTGRGLEVLSREYAETRIGVSLPTIRRWPLPNVVFVVSVEDQATANQRLPIALRVPAACHGVSYEPALGPVDFSRWLDPVGQEACAECGAAAKSYLSADELDAIETDPKGDALCSACGSCAAGFYGWDSGIDWLIVGGESGPRARPCHMDWIRHAVSQASETGTPTFVKQLGGRAIFRNATEEVAAIGLGWCDTGEWTTPGWQGYELRRRVMRPPHGDSKGGDPTNWPVDLRIQAFPEALL